MPENCIVMPIDIVMFISKYGGSDANRHQYAVEGFNDVLLNKIGEVLRPSSVIGKSLGFIRIQITKRGVGVSDLGDLAYGCLWQGRRDDKCVHIHLFITLFLTCT